MHALHLPSRHVLLTGLFAFALALILVLAADLLPQLDLNVFAGGGTVADPAPVPPASWASDPLAPPTILLMK